MGRCQIMSTYLSIILFLCLFVCLCIWVPRELLVDGRISNNVYLSVYSPPSSLKYSNQISLDINNNNNSYKICINISNLLFSRIFPECFLHNIKIFKISFSLPFPYLLGIMESFSLPFRYLLEIMESFSLPFRYLLEIMESFSLPFRYLLGIVESV